jgi:hypothetical protein
MQRANQNTAKAKRAAAQATDPRLAALARLLARHAARQEMEKGLSPSPRSDYDSDSPSEDES